MRNHAHKRQHHNQHLPALRDVSRRGQRARLSRIETLEGWRDATRARKISRSRTGTVFERSKVPLHKWLYAMYLFLTARKGHHSKQIGITQKSAWFVLHRIREACSDYWANFNIGSCISPFDAR